MSVGSSTISISWIHACNIPDSGNKAVFWAKDGASIAQRFQNAGLKITDIDSSVVK